MMVSALRAVWAVVDEIAELHDEAVGRGGRREAPRVAMDIAHDADALSVRNRLSRERQRSTRMALLHRGTDGRGAASDQTYEVLPELNRAIR